MQGYMDFDIPQRRQLQSGSEGICFSVKMVAQLDSHMEKNDPDYYLVHKSVPD